MNDTRTTLLRTGEDVMLECGHARRVSHTDAHERDALLWCDTCDGMRKQQWHVGDGATLCYWTDRHAYSVIRITRTTITIQRDTATSDPNWKPDFTPGGFFGHTSNDRQRTYTYAPDPDGATRVVRLTKKGWTTSGQRVATGRHEYYDSNF